MREAREKDIQSRLSSTSVIQSSKPARVLSNLRLSADNDANLPRSRQDTN